MLIQETTPLFPRYIFARFDREQDGWQPIRNTRGVSYIISTPDNRPIPIHDEIMTVIRDYKPHETPPQANQEFKAGDRVKIAEGVLAGLEGLFVEDQNKRVYALLDVMGKSIKVPLKSIVAA